jgi:predicted HNH restriction endonuclease
MVFKESELIIPALGLLKKNPDGVSTSDLIRLLTNEMQPSGKDAELLAGRNDTHFSQKVRNLVGSHRNLEGKGLATFDQGMSKITREGSRYLRNHKDVHVALVTQGFSSNQIDNEVNNNYEGLIFEGALDERTSTQRVRSNKLRTSAIDYFKSRNNGAVFCEACNFSFSGFYGTHGEGFIEVHHKKPIHEMDISGTAQMLQDALKDVSLVCSNCHRMIHKKIGKMLSLRQLRKMISYQRRLASGQH